MRRIRLTESQLTSLIKKTVKMVLKEDDDIFNSDSSEHNHNIENFTGEWEFDDENDILYLNFGEEGEEYKVDWDADMIGGYSPPTLEHPGDWPELEVTINSITKIHPNEKKMSKDEFYSYLKELRIYHEFWEYLNDVGEERASNKGEQDYDDFD